MPAMGQIVHNAHRHLSSKPYEVQSINPESVAVERVTFRNAKNGFSALRAKARGHRDRLTAAVGLSCFTAGQWPCLVL
jgi:hypothetical protein